MRKSDFITASLTSVMVSFLLFFLSCANSERIEEDGFGELEGGSTGMEEVGSEGGSLMDLGIPADGDLDSAPQEDIFGEESGSLADEGGSLMEESSGDMGLSDEVLEDVGGDVGDMGLPSEEEMAATASGDNLGMPADTNLDQTFGSEESFAGLEGDGDLKSNFEDDPSFDPVLGLPSDDALTKAAEQEAAQADMEAFADNMEAGEFQEGTTTSFGQASTSWSGFSRIPTIPAAAFEKNGAILNRFYFVRKGDTADSMGQLLMGSPSAGSQLKAWNRGRFKPGKLVFYQSTLQPRDSQMRSFYQERNVPPGEVTVKRGETLSVIAKRELGSPMSYKEIAVVNGLSSADAVEPGQRLAVYPANLGGSFSGVANNDYPTEQAVSDIPQEPEPTFAAPPPPPPAQTPSFQAENQVQFAPPPPPVQQRPSVDRRRARGNQGFSVGKFFQQNMFLIIIGVAIIGLAGALMVVNKKRKARQAEDFNDDIFGDQMK